MEAPGEEKSSGTPSEMDHLEQEDNINITSVSDSSLFIKPTDPRLNNTKTSPSEKYVNRLSEKQRASLLQQMNILYKNQVKSTNDTKPLLKSDQSKSTATDNVEHQPNSEDECSLTTSVNDCILNAGSSKVGLNKLNMLIF